MSSQVRRVEDMKPLSHERWMEIGKAQNETFVKLLVDLGPGDWDSPTDCVRWTVKDVAAHVLGMAEAFTSFREMRHQLRASFERRKDLGSQLNAMNEAQVLGRRHLSGDEIVSRLQQVLPRFLRLRSRLGGFGRWIPMWDPNLGAASLRYLTDTVFARDAFMHRIDIARATGRVVPIVEADADLIADVVRDWARRTRADVTLELLGPGGGTFVCGSGAETVVSDPVEFCRLVSGRRAAESADNSSGAPADTAWVGSGCPF